MSTNDEIFQKYEDESGEAYYCPVNAVADKHIVSEWETDNCVEVSTAGRYSGHLNVVDQSPSERCTREIRNRHYGCRLIINRRNATGVKR